MNRILAGCAAILLLAGAVPGEDVLTAGTYKGQWTGASGGGDIHVTFKANGEGKLAPEVGFTLEGQEVACKVLSFKIDGAKLTMVYQFDLQGTTAQSATEAVVKGKAIEGTYKTTAGDQVVDGGTWKATAP